MQVAKDTEVIRAPRGCENSGLGWFTALILILAGLGSLGLAAAELPSEKPNFVVIFADDLGYGDLGSYGHPTIRTPNLDRMAVEGQKWTNFYAASSVCTPSRAALLTGRYAIRSGMESDQRIVLFSDSRGGLPSGEITLAEQLKGEGYATACIGKWHLGHLPEYLPERHGFDVFYGVPFANTMERIVDRSLGLSVYYDPKVEHWKLPLMRGEDVIEVPADQRTLTRRYTEEAIRFIRENDQEPFFLFLSHTMPHVPLFRSEEFVNRSLRGRYGDVVEELDWSVGQVLQTLKEEGLAENTLVVFTSDNGPALGIRDHGGSAGLLRGGKIGTWEGGMRVPGIFWWPGRIEPGVVTDIGTTLDFFTTFTRLAGAAVPSTRVIDGLDLSAVLFGAGPSPRQSLAYFKDTRIFAFRQGLFKAHFLTQESHDGPVTEHATPLLFHLGRDPSEQFDLSQEHPTVLKEIRKSAEALRATIKPVEDQLAK